MRRAALAILLVLLPLAGAATPAHADTVVTDCTETALRNAVDAGGTVTFTCSGTITLTSTIRITANTTIDGSGQSITISGNHQVPVFWGSRVTLNLNRLTIADGKADSGGGIYFEWGTLTVSNSTFAGNSADLSGGGILCAFCTLTVSNSTFTGNSGNNGGGINNNNGSTLTVSNSTFTGNSASAGGGIINYGMATVSNSTFAGNSTAAAGGGIYSGAGTLTVTNSTFADNSAVNRGGGIYNYNGTVTLTNSTLSGNSASSSGGGIYSSGSTMLENTLVANSPAGNNCAGTITDGGGNLSWPASDTTCPGLKGDPRLSPLQHNGGPTQTMSLLPGSAAIDAANDAICAAEPVNNRDQRGATRPYGPHCDIGAVEQEPLHLYLPLLAANGDQPGAGTG